MEHLSIVGASDGHIILVSSDGERFKVSINDALLGALRTPSPGPRVTHRSSPKDIQAHVRRGLTARQVADLTGEELSYIEKFEGAVLAERRFVVDQALAVAVTQKNGPETTFGASVRSRLEDIAATEEEWSAWKEESGWHVELLFFEGDVEHRARWSFDPRKHLISPANNDAAVLSRHEPMPTTLIPKLSAVPVAERPERFDSDIFEASDLGETGPMLDSVPYGRLGDSPEEGRMADTADLLEILRRKRGERDISLENEAEKSRAGHPSTGGIHLVEDDEHTAEVTPITHGADLNGDDDPEPPPSRKKTRPVMPSWDDIVFGARSDDDLA
ncbi:unannotated protein [freshwater metagenome]|uniref:Unannotated protein n=1 Tax=freshwater metagenome TaxID=449393 RepID=A0A6J6DQA9_9ZZZZ|nr:DUF3071 domain-containing protein [Actinomycetota bacterium]